MRWWHRWRGHRIRNVFAEFNWGGYLYGQRCSCGKEWPL